MSNLMEGDCLEKLCLLADNSVDSLITDPPAGISFMNKEWDKDKGGRDPWIAWMSEIMRECLRAMKPGAHGLVWALPRTSHWTATALENAGFQIRDVITHLFGSGFPKSLNLGDGFGTALKPASEHWVLIRKPCSEKTVAANVLKHGTGGINIDGCRIEGITSGPGANMSNDVYGEYKNERKGVPNIISTKGRFPANLILDEVAAEMLDEQVKGKLHAPGNKKPGKMNDGSGMFGSGKSFEAELNYKDFDGGASRFFYVAKASKREKNEGLEGMPLREPPGSKRSEPAPGRQSALGSPRQNFHPTVKPLKLMEYLITLITPPSGIVLDPFMGSGSTGVAAKRLGFRFIGIEKEKEYFDIAEKRINISL